MPRAGQVLSVFALCEIFGIVLFLLWYFDSFQSPPFRHGFADADTFDQVMMSARGVLLVVLSPIAIARFAAQKLPRSSPQSSETRDA